MPSRAEKILTAFRSKVRDDAAYNAVRGILDEFRMGCKNGDCISDCAGRVAMQLGSRLKGDWGCVLVGDLFTTLSRRRGLLTVLSALAVAGGPAQVAR